MPISSPARRRRSVSATSSADGVGSPLGWLCTRTMRRGREPDRRCEDLARVHQRGRERALGDAQLGEEAVAAVEQQHEEAARARAAPGGRGSGAYTAAASRSGSPRASGVAGRAPAELERRAHQRQAPAPARSEQRRERRRSRPRRTRPPLASQQLLRDQRAPAGRRRRRRAARRAARRRCTRGRAGGEQRPSHARAAASLDARVHRSPHTRPRETVASLGVDGAEATGSRRRRSDVTRAAAGPSGTRPRGARAPSG